MLADPDFPNKMKDGRIDEIRKCIYCDLGCTTRHVKQYKVDCAVNPRLSRETERDWMASEDNMTPALSIKRVVIAGGGIAGMEAARVARLRGHDVVLCEKNAKLGGTMEAAASIPKVFTRELNNISTWLQVQLIKLGIDTRLNTEVTVDLLKELQADAVIIATGSTENKPPIPGIDNSNVMTLLEYLADPQKVGENVVIIGGQEGAEIAVGLSRPGKKITLLEESNLIAETPYFIHAGRKVALHESMFEEGFPVFTEAKVKTINNGSVVFDAEDPKFRDGKPVWMQSGFYTLAEQDDTDVTEKEVKEHSVSADTVIIAMGRAPNRQLLSDLKQESFEVHEAGDVIKVHNARHSMHSAALVARRV